MTQLFEHWDSFTKTWGTKPPQMTYKRIGSRSGLKVSRIGLGGWITYGKQVPYEMCSACIKTAFDVGINYFDTSESYGDGRCEIDMGKALKEHGFKRSDLVVSSKLFFGDGSLGPNDLGLSRKHIVEGAKASLERMQLEYMDIFVAHRSDVETPIEETVRAFNYLIDHGLCYYWAVSEWTAAETTEAIMVAKQLGLQGPIFEQPQYNMFWRERQEVEYKPLFRNHGIGSLIWSPVDGGILSGKYNDYKFPADSRFAFGTKINDYIKNIADQIFTDYGKSKIERVKLLEPIAKRLGGTTAQLAIAWTLVNPDVTSAVIGASRPEQITENIKALDLSKRLTPDIMEEIELILRNRPMPTQNWRG
ncbi:voltage-dependent potassium channel, beta subunit [Hyaloraphidium curvatum]|nr:voltage-dependent potassium channel, beta subunit [Hyaloraphidium curvatum]